MKKITFFIILLIAGIGCTKNYYGSGDGSYHIDGLSGVSLSQDAPARTMYITVTYDGQPQENVTLSFENLPAGMYATLYTPSGYPTFSSQIQFYDSSAAIGTYRVNLIATGEKTGRKVLPITITITAPPECASTFTGNWMGSNGCTGSSSYTETLATDASVVNRVKLNNFENSGITLYADIKCTGRTVTLPLQTVNGVSYSGNGYFYTSGAAYFLRISYTRTNGSSTISCTESLSR